MQNLETRDDISGTTSFPVELIYYSEETLVAYT